MVTLMKKLLVFKINNVFASVSQFFTQAHSELEGEVLIMSENETENAFSELP